MAERTHELQKAVAELEAFSYSLTHDMRAPLRTIQSFNEIVLEHGRDKLAPEDVELLRRTIESSRRLDRLVLDLLEFTRISRSPIRLEAVDVEHLIDTIIGERLELQPPKAVIKIQRPLPHVSANPPSLTQCIANLLENAVKFVPAGAVAEVSVYAEQNEAGVRLCFKDNGIGINKKEQDRLFHMFQRVHSTSYPGTGIGLAIVRKAVERMHGQTGVQSELGQGSCFWLQLRRP